MLISYQSEKKEGTEVEHDGGKEKVKRGEAIGPKERKPEVPSLFRIILRFHSSFVKN
jgi:hypothetical protein